MTVQLQCNFLFKELELRDWAAGWGQTPGAWQRPCFAVVAMMVTETMQILRPHHRSSTWIKTAQVDTWACVGKGKGMAWTQTDALVLNASSPHSPLAYQNTGPSDKVLHFYRKLPRAEVFGWLSLALGCCSPLSCGLGFMMAEELLTKPGLAMWWCWGLGVVTPIFAPTRITNW